MLNKTETKKRWDNGEGYNCYITEELKSFRKEAWQKTICRHFEEGKELDVLDVGTGPGFFACILSEQGHSITGIDSSAGMLKYARKNAELLNINPKFIEMDVNEITFPDESFDVIVTRNVTWTLEKPEWVYAEFKRILRPSGKLLIYDANWHMHYFDEDMMQRVRQREQRHFEKYGKQEVVCNEDVEYFGSLPLSNTIRPQWDDNVLSRLGFTVSIQENIGQAVYEEWEKELYGESPLFEVCAVKNKMSTEKIDIYNYWQKRSSTFDFSLENKSVEKLHTQIKKHLPAGRLKILDVGTGTGQIAAVTAMLGHEVTGIDLCSKMIEKAKQNADASGFDIHFMCTDAGELPFEDETFDVVISRNVVWALTNPMNVMLQWKRVLKPEGLLIYLDGNHYYYLFNEEAKKARNDYIAITGSAHKNDPGNVDYSEMEKAALKLPLSKLDRPYQWDAQVLPKLGFEVGAIEEERPQDHLKDGVAQGYYTSFLVAAKKQQETRR